MAFIQNGEFREQGEKDKFFKLENDKDVKLVRFLHKDIQKVPVVTYHTINVDGYDRKVSCLRNYDEPLSKCPLCSKNDKYSSRKYLQLLVYATDERGNPTGATEVQVWDRGKRFVDKLDGIQRRLNAKGKNLCDVLFDIERIGKKGSTDTTYELYERTDLNSDNYPFELPTELYNPIGKSIYDYNYDELVNVLNGKPAVDEGVEKREPVQQNQPAQQPAVEEKRTEAEPVYTRRRL